MGRAKLFRGHAAVFHEWAPIYDYVPESNEPALFRERIRPGAFRDALAEGGDVEVFYNHNVDHVLARRSNGTLRLKEAARGLAVEFDAADIPLAETLATLVARGDLGKMSFQFAVRDAGAAWRRGNDGMWSREMTSLDIFEVSIVTRPAYVGTDVKVVRGDAAAHAARTAAIDRMLACNERRLRIDAAMARL